MIQPSSAKTIRSVITASSLGTMIEWYDFYIFGMLAKTISTQFFPEGNPTAALLSTLAIFAAGFIVRPFWCVGIWPPWRFDWQKIYFPANVDFNGWLNISYWLCTQLCKHWYCRSYSRFIITIITRPCTRWVNMVVLLLMLPNIHQSVKEGIIPAGYNDSNIRFICCTGCYSLSKIKYE